MKARIKQIIAIQISILYCFVIGWLNPAMPIGQQNREQQKQIPANSSFSCADITLFTAGLQQKNTLSIGQSIVPCFSKVNPNDLYTAVRSYSHLLTHATTAYIFYQVNIAFRLQEADIVFPFHYFW